MKRPWKNIALPVAAAFAVCIATSISPAPAPSTPLYTHEEHRRLTRCVGTSDAAWYIAGQKLAKVPQQRVEAEYGSDSDPIIRQIRVDFVKKVYGDDVEDAVMYGASYFDGCAAEAGVPASRVQMAHYCYYRSQVASIAWQMKSNGLPIEKAQASPYVFDADSLKRVVAQVYATSPRSREAASEGEWKQCMSILVADE